MTRRGWATAVVACVAGVLVAAGMLSGAPPQGPKRTMLDPVNLVDQTPRVAPPPPIEHERVSVRTSIYVDALSIVDMEHGTPPPRFQVAAQRKGVHAALLPPQWTRRSHVTATVELGKGQYAAIPFTAPSGIEKLKRISFQLPSSQRSQPYGAFISLSRLPGDVRPGRPDAVDPMARPACRGPVHGYRSDTGVIVVDTRDRHAGEPSQEVCRLEPGESYYLNVIFDSPAQPMDPSDSPCRNPKSGRCKIMITLD
jgi:hypothetical protein